MQLSSFLVYVWCKLSVVNNVVFTFTILSVTLLIVLFVVAFVSWAEGFRYRYNEREDTDWARYLALRLVLIKHTPWLVLLTVSLNMIPTQKELATILILPKIANSEFVNKELPDDVSQLYQYTKDYLKQILKGEENE